MFKIRPKMHLNGSQLAKLTKVVLSCYCHEAVGLNISIILKEYNFCVNVTFGAIFLKNRYFANNCLIKVRIWEFLFTHITHINVIILRTANFVSTKWILVGFLLNTNFPSHLALLKDWFIKKMLLKRANTRRLFLTKL